MFVTPESFKDLEEMILKNYGGEYRAVAFQVMMFTNNLCHKMVEDAIQEDSVVC